MGRYLRSKRLRDVLYTAADGKCEHCGCDLPDNWHADHIDPWCITGRTNVHEMQALCPKCNGKKGANMNLRSHQSEAVKAAREAAQLIAEGKRPTMLFWVCPGGGKSKLPELVLEQLPPSFRLAWVVPRDALRKQAARDYPQFRDSGNDRDPCRSSRGFITTYQSIVANPDLWRHELSRHPYLLFLDETHHLKQKGDNFNEFAGAIDRLPWSCLAMATGTLSTSDNSKLWGLSYEAGSDGEYVSPESSVDFYIRYSRAKALTDNAIVPVEFHHHDGPVKYEDLAKRLEVEIGSLSLASKRQEGRAIWTALETEMADAILSRCMAHFREHGTKLLVCLHNRESAKRVQRELSKQLPTYLAISGGSGVDAPDSIKQIAEFKTSSDRCALVTVAVAYEGLDVPEVSHIAGLTHIRSAPWIEQMIGRAWRQRFVDGKPTKEKCWVFIPDDPRMNRVIDEIHAEQSQVVRVWPEDRRPASDGTRADSDFLPKQSGHSSTRATGLDGGDAWTTEQQRIVDAILDAGTDLTDDWRALLSTVGQGRHMGCQPALPGISVGDEEDKLKREIARKCRQADNARNCNFGHHQGLLMGSTGKSIKDMSIEELRRAERIAASYVA